MSLSVVRQLVLAASTILVVPSVLRKHALTKPSEAGIEASAALMPVQPPISATASHPPSSNFALFDFRRPDLRWVRLDIWDRLLKL